MIFPFSYMGGNTITLGTTMANDHYTRVTNDGGVLPGGVVALANLIDAIANVYSVTTVAGFNAAVPVILDAHFLGFRLGQGTGTTLGQAARTLYSLKGTENLLTYSSDFSNVVWSVQGGATKTTGQADPSGGTTAVKIISSGVSGAAVLQNIGAINSSLSYTQSVFVKKGTLDWVAMARIDGASFAAWFDLTNGVVGTVVAGNSATITNMGNGWFKCTITNTALYTLTSSYLHVAPSSGDNNVAATGYIYVAFPQINTGSVALPYTATTSTAEYLADVVQTSVPNQPLLLAHSGQNYWWGSGVAGNYCSTPDSVASQIIGNIEIIVNTTLDSLTGTGYYCLLDKSLVSPARYQYVIEYGKEDGKVYYSSNVGGANFTSISTATLSSAGITNLVPFWLKINRNSTTGAVTFWISLDPITTLPLAVTWTQLGTTRTTIEGDGTAYSASIEIGRYRSGGSEEFQGRIYRATISNSIGGQPVVDFNAQDYNAATSQSQFTSSGVNHEVWTLNYSTGQALRGCLVDRTKVAGRAGDAGGYEMTNSNISISQPNTVYVSASVMATFDGSLVPSQYLYDSVNGSSRQTVLIGPNNSMELYAGGSVLRTITDSRLIQNWSQVINGGSSDVYLNSVKQGATGNAGANALGGLTIMGRYNSTQHLGGLFNTLIIVTQADQANITTINNLIKTMNNL